MRREIRLADWLAATPEERAEWHKEKCIILIDDKPYAGKDIEWDREWQRYTE